MFRLQAGYFPAYPPDLSLQVAHAGFIGIFTHDASDRRVVKMQLAGIQAVFFELAWQQETFGNLQLLFLNIAGKLNQLHAVQQSRRDRIGIIGRGNEHDLGKIVSQLQVVIRKGVVLLRVQHFKQRRSRVAAKILRLACQSHPT